VAPSCGLHGITSQCSDQWWQVVPEPGTPDHISQAAAAKRRNRTTEEARPADMYVCAQGNSLPAQAVLSGAGGA
jgi:hypothetical protein